MPEVMGGAIAAQQQTSGSKYEEGPGVAAGGHRARAASYGSGAGAHREALKAVRDAQREKYEKQVFDYYAAVDEDGNGRLDRDEIGALLKAITGKAPTRQGLDIVMKAAGGEEEEKAGGVTKENLLRALKKCERATRARDRARPRDRARGSLSLARALFSPERVCLFPPLSLVARAQVQRVP